MARNTSTPVRLDTSLEILLRCPLERWAILDDSGVEISASGAEQSVEDAHSRLRTNLIEEMNRMTEQELLLLTRWAEGHSVVEIAAELSQPVATVFRRLASLRKGIQKRLLGTMQESAKRKPSTQRLEAFRALRTRLQLTSGTARQWQEVINEARR